MASRKSYGQFCGLARALDRVGDRWTLLVVRELLVGRRTFRELEGALDGIGTALLTDRLGALVADGLVERNDAPARSKAVAYRLTDAGRSLEPVVLEMIRWGARWMAGGPGADRSDPAWAPLALRALLEGEPSRSDGTAHLDVSGTWVTVAGRAGRRTVAAGRVGDAAAEVRTSLPMALAVASGELTLAAAGARVSGRRATAAALLEPARVRRSAATAPR